MAKHTCNTKSGTIKAIAAATNLTLAQVKLVLTQLIVESIQGLKRDGVYYIHGIARLQTKMKAALPERAGRNPFTKEPVTFKAKPESKRILVKPVTAFKRAFDTGIVKRKQRADQ